MSSNQKIILLIAVVFVISAWFIWYFSRDITRKECIEIKMSGQYHAVYEGNKCVSHTITGGREVIMTLKLNRFTDEVSADTITIK